MRHHLTALAACLAIATPVSAAAPRELVQTRFMGDLSCGGWRSGPADFQVTEKALLLNWVLGFIIGRSSMRGDDLLATVQVSTIAVWLDDYCAANPLENLATAAVDLERVLIARRRPG